VLPALHEAPGRLSINELMVKVNASWGRIEKSVQLMSLESPAPLVKQGSKLTQAIQAAQAAVVDKPKHKTLSFVIRQRASPSCGAKPTEPAFCAASLGLTTPHETIY
jgi:hypothetical protein